MKQGVAAGFVAIMLVAVALAMVLNLSHRKICTNACKEASSFYKSGVHDTASNSCLCTQVVAIPYPATEVSSK